MIQNRTLIDDVIKLRTMKNDPVQEYSTRNKASPIELFSPFQPFSYKALNHVLTKDIDGLKLKFKYVVLFINFRLKNN